MSYHRFQSLDKDFSETPQTERYAHLADEHVREAAGRISGIAHGATTGNGKERPAVTSRNRHSRLTVNTIAAAKPGAKEYTSGTARCSATGSSRPRRSMPISTMAHCAMQPRERRPSSLKACEELGARSCEKRCANVPGYCS